VKQLAGTSKIAETSELLAKGKYSRQQIQKVMDLLLAEMPFLLDVRVQEMVRGMKDEDAALFQTDALLTALGVEDREDLDELCSFFFPDDKTADLVVHANDVIKYIKDFVVKRQQSKTKTGGTGIVIKVNSFV